MLAAESDLEIVAEASSGHEAAALALASDPDVILMDLRMPGGDGVDAIARLQADGSKAKVIVLTTYDTDADILRAVEAGATGYLLKDTPRADLIAAIRAAARGETVLAPVVASRLVTRMRGAGRGSGRRLRPCQPGRPRYWRWCRAALPTRPSAGRFSSARRRSRRT